MKLSLIIQGIDRATAPIRHIAGAARGLSGALKGASTDARASGRAIDAVGKGDTARKLRDISIAAQQVDADLSRAGRSAHLAVRPFDALKLAERRAADLRKASYAAYMAGGGFGTAARQGGVLRRSIDAIAAPVRNLRQGMARLTAEGTRTGATLRFVGRAAETGAYGVGYMLGSVIRLGGMGGLLGLRASARLATTALRETLLLGARVTATGLAAGAAGAGYLFGSGLALAGRFEQYQVQLEGLLGTAEKAKAGMKWVRDFAQKTPYEVDQVTAAFVRARGVGIDPMNGALRKMGDAASGNNKTLLDAVEAVADAQTGEFERLKEFLITTSVKGSQVKFSYLTKAGKSAAKTVKKDMASIQKAVLDIFDERNGGGMERQSRTLFGMWSNLKDMIAGFQLDVADSGAFEFIKGKVAELLNWVNKLASDGTLKKWAKEVSDWLVKAGKKIEGWANKENLHTLATALKLCAESAWLVVRAVAAIARTITVVVDAAKFMSTHDIFGRVVAPRDLPYDRALNPQPLPKPRWPKPSGVAALSPAWVAGRKPQRAEPWSFAASYRGRAQPARVGGTLDINLRTDPGTRASVTRIAPANRDVPIVVNRGRAMAQVK